MFNKKIYFNHIYLASPSILTTINQKFRLLLGIQKQIVQSVFYSRVLYWHALFINLVFY